MGFACKVVLLAILGKLLGWRGVRKEKGSSLAKFHALKKVTRTS